MIIDDYRCIRIMIYIYMYICSNHPKMENCVITTYRNFTKFYLSEGYQKSIHFFLEGGGNSFARFRKCRTQQISKFAILCGKPNGFDVIQMGCIW